MNAGPTFVARGEPAKTMEPGQRAFHDPPGATKPTAMGRAALGELAVDPAAMQRLAMRLRIVHAGFASPDRVHTPTGPGDDAGDSGMLSASAPNGMLSLFDALQKQLGLKLERGKRPLPVLVIDHVERPTDN